MRTCARAVLHALLGHSGGASAGLHATATRASPQNDPSAIMLKDIIKHPVGLRYFMQHMSSIDPDLGKSVKAFKAIEKFKKNVVPERKMKKVRAGSPRHTLRLPPAARRLSATPRVVDI